MTRCLIGHSGFVGSNLLVQETFDEVFNSTTIEKIRGKSFDEIWCAGVSAVKWYANQHPEEDWHNIHRLLQNLGSVKTGLFVLISTIDVYRSPISVDEETPIVIEGLHPYGRHRRHVEEFVANRFPNHHIIRLPGLYGRGLKKNIIYDLMHNNQVEQLNSDAVFQFYPLDNIVRDIKTVINHGPSLMNFATEPLSVHEVALNVFGLDLVNYNDNPPRYDMQTRFASLFCSPTPYILSRQEVLNSIKNFVNNSLESAKT